MGTGMTRRKRLARFIANHLPHSVVYFAVIRVWSATTTGQWANTEAAGLSVDTMIGRFHLLGSSKEER